MSIKQIFAVRDAKAEAYQQPFFSHSKGAAIRAVADYANEEGTPLNKHPEDYMLFHIGAWSEMSGEIRGLEQPEAIISILELMTDKPLTKENLQRMQNVRQANGLPPLPGQSELEDAIADAINKKQ
jgi:hypothetical protein